MKWFISSDIHSFYDEWMSALKKAGFKKSNKDHGIIVLGDLLDRGEKPVECLKFVNKMHKEGRAILIKGNHEDLLESVFRRGYFQSNDDHNGTLDTCCYLSGIELDGYNLSNQREIIQKAKNKKLVKTYLSNVVNYAELGDNIFVHGWIPVAYDSESKLVYNKNWRKAIDIDWYDARWLNGMSRWHAGVKESGKTIWCGHWHSSYGHSKYHNDGVEYLNRIETVHMLEDGRVWPYVNHTPFKDDGIVAMDATTAVSGFVNVEVLEC